MRPPSRIRAPADASARGSRRLARRFQGLFDFPPDRLHSAVPVRASPQFMLHARQGIPQQPGTQFAAPLDAHVQVEAGSDVASPAESPAFKQCRTTSPARQLHGSVRSLPDLGHIVAIKALSGHRMERARPDADCPPPFAGSNACGWHRDCSHRRTQPAGGIERRD